jgi:hypothetical protein
VRLTKLEILLMSHERGAESQLEGPPVVHEDWARPRRHAVGWTALAVAIAVVASLTLDDPEVDASPPISATDSPPGDASAEHSGLHIRSERPPQPVLPSG